MRWVVLALAVAVGSGCTVPSVMYYVDATGQGDGNDVVAPDGNLDAGGDIGPGDTSAEAMVDGADGADAQPPSDAGPADAGVVDGGCLPPRSPSPTDAGIYCPFASGSSICSPSSEHCCEPGVGASSCVPSSTSCVSGEMDWGCQDPITDCAGFMVCCGQGAGAAPVIHDGGTSCSDFATGLNRTLCQASCSSLQIQLCTVDSECTPPAHCVAFRAFGFVAGACQ